jgi:hypothetical protein
MDVLSLTTSKQAVAHQHTAGVAALLDAHQLGEAGAPDERECAHRPPGVNGTGKAVPLDPRGWSWRSTASCSRARSWRMRT